MSFQPWKKKELPRIEDFIKSQKPGYAILSASHGLKPDLVIQNIVNQHRLNYTVRTIDVAFQIPEQVDHAIRSREVFAITQPRITVLLFVEQADETMQEYIKTSLLDKIKKRFIILVIDDIKWSPWIGFLQKLTSIPHFKLEPPNENEKATYLEQLHPYQIVYKQEGLTDFHTKLNQIASKMKNLDQLDSYVAGCKAMYGIYTFHTEQESEANFFKAICFLRSEAHAKTKDQWQYVEDILTIHPNSLKTLMVNQPSFSGQGNAQSMRLRSRWLNEFSEHDTCGFKKPDMTPAYVASVSWNEVLKAPNVACPIIPLHQKRPFHKVTTISAVGKTKYASQHNFFAANEYCSNQFTFFRIFDQMTQLLKPSLFFENYVKMLHETIPLELLIKKLADHFGMLLLIPKQIQQQIQQPVLVLETEEKEEPDQKEPMINPKRKPRAKKDTNKKAKSKKSKR
jgi:hypothetical protein